MMCELWRMSLTIKYILAIGQYWNTFQTSNLSLAVQVRIEPVTMKIRRKNNMCNFVLNLTQIVCTYSSF